MGKSETWLSRGLNALDGNGNTHMPNRDFVDVVLAACEVSVEVRDRARDLYMEALATIDKARHADYRAADRAAAAQDRCEKALRMLEDLHAQLAQQAEQHAQEVASLEGEMERREQDWAADLAAAQEREQKWAADLATAQSKISERTGQLAAEREGRRVDQATIEALRSELVKAHTTIETLRGELAEAHTTIEALREEPCRHDREEAVLAEAIAITEQALAAEKERAEVGRTPLPEEETDLRKPATGPVALFAASFLVFLATPTCALATALPPEQTTAMGLQWAAINELRGSTAAACAAAAVTLLSLLVWVGALLKSIERDHLPVDHDQPSTETNFATWI
ncbi:hypothetical protein AB0C13_18835 [Streptomyces sp. NPDC049099]|uniref:hypothetical protein n=1 Tax=Streptomyces sp. NPDC049099 TaxID=3155768 RepID=UPI003423975E